ncbi:MAG: helix-turn-helix domain-containing protein [Pseudonocardiaceae bacterium]
MGLNVDEVAAALGAELRLRSRAAYRYALGMSGQAAADVYNARFGTSQSPAPMSKTRISEYENWPIGRNTRRPSPTVLHNLADVYGTSPRKLLDHHDLAALTEQQRHSLLTPGEDPWPPWNSQLCGYVSSGTGVSLPADSVSEQGKRARGSARARRAEMIFLGLVCGS